MGNTLAYLMLLAWPAVCMALFTRLSVERAIIWSIIGAYLLLPPVTTIDLPLVPNIDKYSVANVAVIAIILFYLKQKVSFRPDHAITRIIIIALLLGTIATVITNRDAQVFLTREDTWPIEFPSLVLPGLRLIDVASVLSSQLIMLIPFFLARQFLSSDQGLRDMFYAFMVAGLYYSIPALWEIRFSPQTNVWIYGFFQHDFIQMIRGSSFRPIVFFPHALWLALFFAMAMASAAALLREADVTKRGRYLLAMVYLFCVLFLCKSMASQVYALILLPMILFASHTWMLRVAMILGAVAVTYPMLRSLHLIPLDFILAQFEAINPARAASLDYRIWNEEQLLTRSAERPLFGWGGWGRNLFFDPESGRILTIPDGRWIVVFGEFGWFGYLSQMGIVALPIVLIRQHLLQAPDHQLNPLVPPLCLMLGITMLDMLLNDTLVPMTWLMIGALVGYAERIKNGSHQPGAEPAPQPGAAPLPRRRRTVL